MPPPLGYGGFVTAMDAMLIFDLDDTLVDTFELLITPLEHEVARRLRDRNLVALPPGELVQRLLDLRRRDPAGLRARLSDLVGKNGPVAVDVHRDVFADFPIEALIIAHETREMIAALGRRHRLALMTEGGRAVQQAKIEHLGLAPLFDHILIVDPADGETKDATLRAFLAAADVPPAHAIVIGNRLDREISAAHRLGVRTIWVRAGEGSELSLPAGARPPDAIVDNVLDVPRAIEALAG